MELAVATEPERMNILDHRPQHDTFGIDNAMLVAPGDAERSVLYHRIARRGRGQMPPLVTSVVDETAVHLIRDWIESQKPARAFVHDWKREDVLPRLESLAGPRPPEAGRQAFLAAGCNQCHRVGKEGGSVGPDLTAVGQRLGRSEILEAILTPSEKIAPEFASTVIETLSGQVVIGRIEREDEGQVVLRADASSPPIVVATSEIAERSLSPLSNMPTGTLNTLSLDEILDLLAFLSHTAGEGLPVEKLQPSEPP
jgi:putative heme-binding domain-containing protein